MFEDEVIFGTFALHIDRCMDLYLILDLILQQNHTALEHEKSILISHLQCLSLKGGRRKMILNLPAGGDNSTDLSTCRIAFVSMTSNGFWSLKTEGIDGHTYKPS